MNFEEFLAKTAEEYSLSFSELYELDNSEFKYQPFEDHDFQCESVECFQKKFGIKTVTCGSVVLFLKQIKMENENARLKIDKRKKEKEIFRLKWDKKDQESENRLLNMEQKRVEGWNKSVDYFLFASSTGLFFVCSTLKKRLRFLKPTIIPLKTLILS